MKLTSACTASILVICVIEARPAAQSPPVCDVEFLGNAASVTALNDLGQVIGTFPMSPANERGWVASSGSPITPLPLPPGRMSSRVYDINEAGVIAGAVSSVSYADPSFGAIAAIWTPNGSGGYAVTELGKLPGDVGSAAKALNDVGDVVGYSRGGMFERAVWFTSPTGIADLTPTGAFDPTSINDQRVMVCYSSHCSRLDLDTLVLEDLGVPPGSYQNTLGAAINASNQVAGVAILATSTSCDRQAARFTDGVGWQILSGCGSSNRAASLNALGDVTLWSNTAAYVRFEGLGTFKTEDLIDAPLGHWFLFGIPGHINGLRQIAIAGSNSATGQSGVLLLTPRSDVGTLACAGDGSSGPCPCGNVASPGSGAGCAHSAGGGAALAASGSSVVANDDLVLRVTGGPANHLAIFLQGSVGATVPFADGIRCAGSPSVRLQTFALDSAGAGTSSVSIVAQGSVGAGTSRVYQTWFRDAGGPCGHGSNLSSGLRVDWQ
jgi:hypothetical protein